MKYIFSILICSIILANHIDIFAGDKLTPEMVINMQTISNAKISPDGNYVMYTKLFPAGENEGNKYRYSELWIMNLKTFKSKLYASREKSAKKYKWSADSKAIYFISRRTEYSKNSQIYKMPVDGGTAQIITDHPNNIIDFAVTANQEKIIFISKIKRTPEQQEKWDNGEDWVINEKEYDYNYLYVFDIDKNESKQISPDSMHVFSFAIEPDEGHVIYQAASQGSADYSYMFRDLFRVYISGEKNQLICEHDGKLGKMAVSPDGKFLAFQGGVDISDPEQGSLLLTEIGSGSWQNLTKDFLGTVTDINWIDDTNLIICAETYNHTSVFQINRKNGKMQEIFGKGKVFKSLDLANDKSTFVCEANAYDHPDELYLGNLLSGKLKRLTDSNPELAQVNFIKPEEFKWQSRDNVEIQGIVIKPDNFTDNGKAPLYVYVHGGPEGARQIGWNNRYNNWPQIMSQKGCVVFIPNYRGSTGRGVNFAKADHGDMMGVDFNDVLDGIDALIAQRWVDPKKVGIVGGSYGGYMAAWAATKYSDRFAVAVMSYGISNQISKMGVTDTPYENSLVHWNGFSWEKGFDLAWERSPLKYIANHKTPILITHGENDKRVPLGQGMELFRALKHNNRAPVKFIVYPGEGHGYKKRAHRYHFMINGIEWLEKYILNK